MSPLLPLLLLPLAARANGSFAVSDQGTSGVRSSDFRALYLTGLEPDTTIAVLQSAYVGDAADFAWIMPIPAPIVDGKLAVIPAAALDAMVRETEPRTVVWGAGACGMKGDALGDSGSAETSGITVLGEYEAGPYEVLELDALASADLTGWLTDQGFVVDSATEPLLDLHSGEGWVFLVVTLRDADAADRSRGLPCLAFTYGSEQVVYPLRISASTASEEVETLVMVWGEELYEPAEDPWVEPELGEDFVGEDFAAWYRSRVQQALQATEGRAWVREWATHAGQEQGWHLWEALQEAGLVAPEAYLSYGLASRYRAWLTPTDMDRDLVLVPAQAAERGSLTFYRSEGSCWDQPRLFLGLVLLGGLGLRRRRGDEAG